MKVILEIDHTVSKEEVVNWIEEVLKPNTPCVWGYSFEEHHCGSCHNSQLEKENKISEQIIIGEQQEINRLEKENAELKEQIEKMKCYCDCTYCKHDSEGEEFKIEGTNKTMCQYCLDNNKKFWELAE